MRRIKQIAIVLALVMGMNGQAIAIGAEEVNQNTQVEQEENQDQTKEQTQQENITVPVGFRQPLKHFKQRQKFLSKSLILVSYS